MSSRTGKVGGRRETAPGQALSESQCAVSQGWEGGRGHIPLGLRGFTPRVTRRLALLQGEERSQQGLHSVEAGRPHDLPGEREQWLQLE